MLKKMNVKWTMYCPQTCDTFTSTHDFGYDDDSWGPTKYFKTEKLRKDYGWFTKSYLKSIKFECDINILSLTTNNNQIMTFMYVVFMSSDISKYDFVHADLSWILVIF